jgi:3-oxoacyl-[acyl-carrier protein] reductase
MSDRYQAITNSPFGGAITKRLGLPTPPRLRRHQPGEPVVSGPVAVGTSRGGRVDGAVRDVLRSIGAHVDDTLPAEGSTPPAALVFDATGVDEVSRLRALYEFFHPRIRALAPNGRIVVLSTPHGETASPAEAAAQQAAEGFVRSLGKEIGQKGSTANLVRVAPGGEGAIESTLRFLVSARSAYVSGQAIEISQTEADDVVAPGDWDRPLEARTAVVTGAARGIGEQIASTLARDGADVTCVDIPAAAEALTDVANRIGGSALSLDITASGAPERIAKHIAERQGKVDLVVHNAGITRDKTLGRMSEDLWDSVLSVNLESPARITEELVEGDLLGGGGRVVCVSSVSGIAGNRGQANYAASKAGLIGLTRALSAQLRDRGTTVNAVAPGFIETAMTAAMPIGVREAGRRTNSLVQGGQPVDVAEAVGWLGSPASAGVTGNVVRVCGQALIGA